HCGPSSYWRVKQQIPGRTHDGGRTGRTRLWQAALSGGAFDRARRPGRDSSWRRSQEEGMARNSEPTGWRPPGSAPTRPARGNRWQVLPNLRVPLVVGVGVTLLASTVLGGLALSSP